MRKADTSNNVTSKYKNYIWSTTDFLEQFTFKPPKYCSVQQLAKICPLNKKGSLALMYNCTSDSTLKPNLMTESSVLRKKFKLALQE